MHFASDQLFANAQAHLQAGRVREASAACEQILQTQPRHPRALLMLGMIAHQAGQIPTAIDRLTHAAAADAAVAEPHFLLGLIYQQQGDLPKAAAEYRLAIDRQPNHPKALNNLGRALLDLGEIPQGIQILQRAISAAPNNFGAYTNLGDGLLKSGDLPGAIAAHRRAIAIKPDFAQAHSNLGISLAKQQQIAPAIASMERALAINPKMANPHYNLARLHQDQNRFDNALHHCRLAIELRPKFVDALNLMGNLLGITGDVRQAISYQRQAVDARPGHAGYHSNLLLSLHYLDDFTPEQIFQAHLDWAARHADPAHVAIASNTKSTASRQRIRIGYVSPNFCSHSVAYFIEPVLAAHDRSSVEIFCYSNLARPDAVTARLKTHADHWRDIYNQPDDDVAQTIRRDGIDILVDLAGHTAENRMTLFAQKPAPVQVTWLGYPDTTGLAAVDYRITDAIADPNGVADQLHTEKLIRIDGGCWVYQPPADAPPVAQPPAVMNGFITFGSFNNLPKVTSKVLETWARILCAVPGSRLLIKAMGLSCKQGKETILRGLTAFGIDPGRIELLPWAPVIASHLELYNHIDIALDTFPYNGTTTTCEALWMGVPVISFAGKTHASRVGASLLTHGGFPEFLAVDLEGYVQKCIEFSSDIPQLSILRKELRSRFSASPVFNPQRLANCISKIS
jgi:predicted O-linked N-acetylglucosamine transferase (SPINDLY family)